VNNGAIIAELIGADFAKTTPVWGRVFDVKNLHFWHHLILMLWKPHKQWLADRLFLLGRF
jgi:hypothetical protein